MEWLQELILRATPKKKTTHRKKVRNEKSHLTLILAFTTSDKVAKAPQECQFMSSMRKRQITSSRLQALSTGLVWEEFIINIIYHSITLPLIFQPS
jgi:hypothetical protein